MNPREWEARIVRCMVDDGWEDIPQVGEYFITAMPKILRYIEWLRGENEE